MSGLGVQAGMRGRRGASNSFGMASRDFTADPTARIELAPIEFQHHSVAMWIKPAPVISWHSYFSGNNREWDSGFRFWANHHKPTVQIQTVGNSSVRVQTTQTMPIGEWSHVCVSWDGVNYSIFVNGVLGKTVAIGGVIDWAGSTKILISDYRFYENSRSLLSDVRLYDRAVTPTEISEIIGGVNVSDGLIGWWLLDSDDILDYSGQNNHGVNFSSVYSADGPL